MRRWISFIGVLAIASFLGATSLQCVSDVQISDTMVIYTQVPSEDETDRDTDWAYPNRSRIVLEDLESEGPRRVMTDAFFSARGADLSFDASRFLFSASKREGDPWQIWEMSLGAGRAKQITEGFFRATDPAYLPDGRFVFAGRMDESSPHALYVCNPDGSGVARITFHPQDDRAPVLLPDGRLLFVSGESESPGTSKILAMRYDGTGAGLYYKSGEDGRLPVRPRLTKNRSVFFVSTGGVGKTSGGLLSRVSDARPLNSRVDLTADLQGDVHSVFPLSDDDLLVSYRDMSDELFSIHRFDAARSKLSPALVRDDGLHAVEPIPVQPRVKPMGFVSTVSEEAKSGWLYGQNADLSTLPGEGAGHAAGGTVRVLSMEGSLGDVPIEEDGSFYVELPADTPLRFQTLDDNGHVVRGPSSWIWVRPGVQRGCIGCHEDRETVPVNRVPEAITRPPSVLSGMPETMEAHASLAAADRKTKLP